MDTHTSLATGFNTTLGIEVEELSEDLVRASLPVHDGLRQPFGSVHGGVYASVAETLASHATRLAVEADGNIALGLANQTSFVRPVLEGRLRAVARLRHRGRTTWVWDVEFSDDEGRLCALSRMTIAVRAAPDQPR